MAKKLSISAIIPAYNEERNLKRLFKSLKRQDYPKSKIEYIVVDDGSTDSTKELAKRFGAKVISVETHDIELNKGIGMHAAKNDLVYWFDADMEVMSKDFFKRLAEPLQEDPEIGASFTKEFALDIKSRPVKNSLLRFISYHPLQQDPLYDYFSPSIEGTIIESRKKYSVCLFIPKKIPAVGRILYRRKELLSTEAGKNDAFIDMESVEIYSRAGYQKFAYVPKAKIRHYHAESLYTLVRKRLRNLELDYLPNYDHKYFTWFDINNKRDVFKIVFWVLYANLIFPELFRGIYKMLKYRDHAFLWHPIVAVATTDAIIWGFLSKQKGREISVKFFKKLIPFL